VQTEKTSQRQLSKIPTWLLVLIVPVIAAVAVVATNPRWSAPSSTPTAGSQVRIQDFAFLPKEIRVAPGTKVVVVNADSTTHTMSAIGGQFDTSNLAPGKRKIITAPTTPGTYKFMCQIHPNMLGTLVVSGS
jgi:plastocyanin